MKPKALELLFDPFRYVAGGQALAVGGLLLVAETIAAWFFGAGMASLQHRQYFEFSFVGHLSIVLVNSLSLFALLLIAGYLSGRTQFRVLDLAGTVIVSRWPAALSTLLLAPPVVQDVAAVINQDPQSLTLLGGRLIWMTVTLITILMMVLAHWLAWRAFAISCNARGFGAVTGFLVAVIIASLASFTINSWLMETQLPLAAS
ncbi:hypothetical protein [Lentisalinibacter sediminis]|uniref:hypothetical protein n=1 Tax=Lentisalinibacter sediminis TaxID=2992237 RepID=UPI0038688223